MGCGAVPFLFIFVVLNSFGGMICLVSSIATKAAMDSPKLFTIFQLEHIRLNYFQTNVLSEFSFTNYYGYRFIKFFNVQHISKRKISLLYNIDSTASPAERSSVT